MNTKFAQGCVGAWLMTILVCNPLWADDTEIYFGSANGNYQPNILFVLDASGSMGAYDCAAGHSQTPCPSETDNPSATTTRLSRMVNALTSVLENTSDVNVGLMRFSHGDSGGRITYPIRPIDMQLCNNQPCSASNESDPDAMETVGSQLVEQLGEFRAAGGTPTVGAMLEARRYFAGDPVDFGKTRTNSSTQGNIRLSRVSHPDSYTGGTHNIPDSCGDDLNSESCSTETITGSPIYISPIEHECQPNHIVLLTDGEPTAGATSVTGALALPGIESCADIEDDRGKCGVELADFLRGKQEGDPDGTYDDLRTDLDGDQNLTVHTIGFNIDHPWLSAVADAGGGGYYTAGSATELITAINQIFTTVEDTEATFVAPGATIDSFSRISHRKDIYLALFEPGNRAGWKGNLKKFELNGNPPELHDSAGNEAIDSASGTFKPDSRSFWSAEDDGNDITMGGAASRLDYTTRKLSTYFAVDNADVDLTATVNIISNLHDDFTATLAADSATEEQQIIDWLIGEDVKDEDEDTVFAEGRQHIGDPLHSTPILVNYGGTQEAPDSVAYFGTNEGFVHGIDTTNGDEILAFMPKELIPNLKTLYRNNIVGAEGRPYGMDGDTTLHIKDVDNDGIIEADDEAYLYIGMRRGGRNYYGLDVSVKTTPKFKWQITGGAGSFVELGETWSKPILTKVKVDTEIVEVLIFGGGYDNSQDEKDTRQPDTMGRAIYIVEAEDPTNVIWSGSINPAGATEVYNDMTYSFPSDISVISEGNDNLASQFYVGDMGGRIWRFDIDNGSSGADLVDGGIIADLSTDNAAIHNRRFYHAPDLSLSRVDGVRYINIGIGSGYQAHPLNSTIKDHYFLIRYPLAATGNYGVEDGLTYEHITMDHLYDTTDNLIVEGETDQDREDAADALAESHGWHIEMEDTGEKILGTSNTLDGVIRFTSYLPSFETQDCAPNIGASRFWAVNLHDATPDSESLAKGISNPTRQNRNSDIPGGGIAPPVRTLLVESADKVIPTSLSGANVVWQGDERDTTKRWFWSEKPN